MMETAKLQPPLDENKGQRQPGLAKRPAQRGNLYE
jgi:hypothetical protein